MKMRRIFTVLFALCLAICVMSLSSSAETVVSGTCGGMDDDASVTWTLDSDGTLTISGDGKIGEVNSFYFMPWSQYRDDIKTLVIEEGVTGIGGYTFQNCTNLVSIRFPSGITSIGSRAFSGCSALTEIDIPEGVVIVDSYAFEKCKSLEKVNLADSIEVLGGYVFSECSALVSVDLPENLCTVPNNAFYKCKSSNCTRNITRSLWDGK